MDLHISVIADFKSIFPDIEVVDWCLSGHAWVMKRTQDHPLHINTSTWTNLTPERITKFQREYDAFLKTFDMFVVGHVGGFIQLFEKYNKPIIFTNSVRYDMPYCFVNNKQYINEYHLCLYRLLDKKHLVIISNNKADQKYLGSGSGIVSTQIPSLCLYTNTKYTPNKETFLCTSGDFGKHALLTYKSELPKPHSWNDITEFKGIVCLPYEAGHNMSMFEQFTAGCPMFLPTKSYWKSHPNIQSASAYWNQDPPKLLEEFKDNQYWIDNSCLWDTFASPNTYFFDSDSHLFELLTSFVYKDDTEFRQNRIKSIKDQWSNILANIRNQTYKTQSPAHLSYNRLPLLANIVFDVRYSDVIPQHTYPQRPMSKGDIVFVKTDLLDWFLSNHKIEVPITLVTGVSDFSPSEFAYNIILQSQNIVSWIGCNITVSHPKIKKILIGVGEIGRPNGDHDTLVKLHSLRIAWTEKPQSICIPFHSTTHKTRQSVQMLPKLEFGRYMLELNKYKFVVCMRGNGIDTHRVCETLLMGSVPILHHSGLDDLYAQFPCILVDTFENIDTSNFVWDEQKYQCFLDMFWLRSNIYTHIASI